MLILNEHPNTHQSSWLKLDNVKGPMNQHIIGWSIKFKKNGIKINLQNCVKGVVTLTRTQAVVTNIWFCVSNILEKNKKLQMELFSHNVIFNVLVYIL
jgi:hypothetical protein